MSDSRDILQLRPVAYFKSPFGSKFAVPRQSGLASSVIGEIRFVDEFRNPDALRGIDGFDFLWLLWGFSANERRGVKEEQIPSCSQASDACRSWQPTVRPPRLGGNKQMGVFATRSPFRPNPVGLSSVKVEAVDFEKMLIRVSGADLMDGTPIYDIKPYVSYTDSHPEAASGFVDSCGWETLAVVIPDDLSQALPEGQMQSLKEVLSLDPRPAYKRDSSKEYGFSFCGKEIRFSVSGSTLTVLEIK